MKFKPKINRGFSKAPINDLMESELNQFNINYRNSPISREQEFRSFSIAWLCTFFTDYISPVNIQRVHSFVDQTMDEEDYNSFGWFRIPALQAATYKLTSESRYRDHLLKQLSCGQASFRELMMISTAFITPEISFQNESLRSSTLVNIERVQGYYEENIILRLCTEGSSRDKQEWLRSLEKAHDKKYMNPFIKKLMKGSSNYKCDFFAHYFIQIKTYILFKLLSFLSKKDSFGAYEGKVDGEDIMKNLYEAEKQHPLTNYYIDLSYLKNKPIGLFKGK